MSLLNAWITPQEAIVAVDTDGIGPDGQRMPSSKLMYVPHANAVLAVRGQYAALKLVFLQALNLETFDDLADALPDLAQASEMAMPGSVLVEGVAAGNEFVAVGWSDRLQRMVGRQCVRRGDMPEYTAVEIDRHISPWGEWASGITPVPQAVGDIARAQVAWMERTFPNAACGGNLLVASLGRDSLMIRRVEDFFQERRLAA